MPIDEDGDGYTSAVEADKYAGEKAYILSGDFKGYTKAMTIDLSKLSNVSIADMLGDFKSVEFGVTLDLMLEVSNIINWAYQMTKFIDDSTITEYLYFLIASLEYIENEGNKTETNSKVSLNASINVYLPTQNIVAILTNNDPDKTINILDVLDGIKAYVEITYQTGLHKNPATSRLWFEINGGKLDAYLDMAEIGELIGFGNFFSYGKLDGFDLAPLLGSASATSVAEAIAAADKALDDEIVNTGMLPEGIWGTLNVLLGRLLLSSDFITVGLNESLLADLLKILINSDSEILNSVAEFLPKLYTTNDSDTSGITINFSGNSPSVDINFGFKVGEDYYITVQRYNEMFGKNGKYCIDGVTYSDWSGTRFAKNEDGTYSVTTSTDNANTYVYISSDNYVLKAYAYPTWEGETFDYVPATGEFVKNAAGNGLYIAMGDFSLSASLHDLYVRINKDFSVSKEEKFGEDTDGDGVKDTIDESKFVEIHSMKAYLNMSIDVSLYGSGAAGQDNTIDMSEVLDLLLELLAPTANTGNSDFKVNITNELGRDDGAFLKLDLNAVIDFENWEAALSLKLQKYAAKSNSYSTLFGIYLLDDSIYVDLSGLLGETAKVKLEGVNVNSLIKNSLGKLIGAVDNGGLANDEAGTAAKDEIDIIESNMMDWEYIMLLFRPHEVLLQLNADLINAVYKKIMQIRGEKVENLLPDLGDWLLHIGTDPTTDHTKISLNMRFSDALYLTLDLDMPTITKDVENGKRVISGIIGDQSKYVSLGSIDLEAIVNGGEVDLINALTLPTVGAHMGITVQVTSRGLARGDAGYDDSFAAWLGDELLGSLLSGVDAFGNYKKFGDSGNMTLADREFYQGKMYKYDSANKRYVEETDWRNATHYFQSALTSFTFGSANESINLVIDLKANINLGSVILYGLAGILYSDISIDVSMGYPLNKKLISIYYLGSSRLKYNQTTGSYEVGSDGDIMSDAIYIDATSLGLGKIKFQGVAGILGGSYGYDGDEANTVADASTEADGETNADGTPDASTGSEATPIALNINIENDKLEFSFDTGLFNAILALLNVKLGFNLPNIQNATLSLMFGDNGISGMRLESILDSVGSSIAIAVNPIELTIGTAAFDSAATAQEVKTGYAGLTMSNTAGMMSLVQNILDNLDLNASIEIQNKVMNVVGGNASGYGDVGYFQVLNQRSKITLTGQKRFDNTHPDDTSAGGKGYKLFLALLPENNSRYTKNMDTLKIIVGGNNIFVTGIPVELTGLAAAAQGAISDFLKFLDLGSMAPDMFPLKLATGTDGDDGSYKYPSASDRYDTTDNWTDNGDGTSSYSYTPNLEGLINKLELNLSSRHGYQPYYSGMSAIQRDAGLISIKIEFGKQAFNELMIMIDCILLNLMSTMNSHPSSGGVQNYFINPTSVGINNSNGDAGTDPSGKYLSIKTATEVLQELDTNYVKKNATTEAKVKFLEPYMRALPYALIKWILRDVAYGAAKDLPVVGANSIWDDGTSLFGWKLAGIIGPNIQDLSRIIAGILPLPFAVGDINPSANIYIDLNPSPSEYGLNASSDMSPGIRAIELMVNGRKNGAGTSMQYLKAPNTNMGQYNITGHTANIEEAWDFFMLRITPYADGNKVESNRLIGFDESAEAEIIDKNITPPTSITITDPGRRSGTLVGGSNNGKAIEMRDSTFSNPALFPQMADVTFAKGNPYHSYYQTSVYNDARGTQLVWDASTVDYTAAEPGKTKLAGYVYGYALNTVMYAIPVYISDAAAVTRVRSYTRAEGDANTYVQSDITLNINEANNKFNSQLPDLALITFKDTSIGSRVFGTYRTETVDKKEQMAQAVIGTSEKLSASSSYYKIKGVQINSDGGLRVLPAYTAGLVNVKSNRHYTTVTSNWTSGGYPYSIDSEGYVKYYHAESDTYYYVLDTRYLPTGKNFPAGTISWNTDDFSYDWQGGTGDNSSTINVRFTYQWGFAAEATGSINVNAANYKVQSVSGIVRNGEETKLTVTANSDGSYASRLTLDPMKFNADMITSGSKFSLTNYIKSFTKLNGKWTSNSKFNDYTVKWDLSELEKAMEAITDENGQVDYYKGIKVTVTAYVGGDVFKVLNANGGKYGFVGSDYSTDSKYANSGYIAQAVPVEIVVNSYTLREFNNDVVYDPYNAYRLSGDALYPEGSTIAITVRTVDGTKSDRILTVGTNVKVTAPLIRTGSAGKYTYLDAYNNSVYSIKEGDISYNGYSGSYPLYACFEIGTEYTGIQKVYEQITINEVKPSQQAVNVAHEDTFNPYWFEGEAYESFDVAFGRVKHTMYPDWTTLKYYTTAACTTLANEQNIYAGGTIFAKVKAYVKEGDKNVALAIAKDKDGNIIYDEDGNIVYEAQDIVLRLNVEKQEIASINFFYDEAIGDIYALSPDRQQDLIDSGEIFDVSKYTGAVYAQTHKIGDLGYGIDPINFATNPDAYFRTSERWGNPFESVAVLVNLVKGTWEGARYFVGENGEPAKDEAGQYISNPDGDHKYDSATGKFVKMTAGEMGTSYIAYVRDWTTTPDSYGIKGGFITLDAHIGNATVSFRVRVPNYEFSGVDESWTGTPSIAFAGGTVGGTGKDALTFNYNVRKPWTMPENGTFITKEGKEPLDVKINWVDASSPIRDGVDIKTDGDRKYVERQYYFFDDMTIRYPSEGSFTARIYIDGYGEKGTFVEVENRTVYDLFGEFRVPNTATVSVDGEAAPITGVPIRWTDWSNPTSDEIAAGKFTRHFKLLFGDDDNKVYEQEFVINNAFTLEETYGFINNAYGSLRYRLTSDIFHLGLPQKSVLAVGDKRIDVDLNWDVVYGLNGFAEKNVRLTITSEYLSASFDVAVTVDDVSISGLSAGNSFTLDPYGRESSFFASGDLVDVSLLNGGTAKIVANYSLSDIYAGSGIKSDAEFYANISRFFGKTYNVRVNYTYPGMEQPVDGGVISVYVVDRTVFYMGEHEYRSIIIDPFIHSDVSHLANDLHIVTRLDYGMTENTFAAYFDWSKLNEMVEKLKKKDPTAGDPLKFMATAIVYAEDANGTHVYADITDDDADNAKYVTVEEYVNYMKALTGNDEFVCDRTVYRRVEQRFNLPVTVLDRNIESSELVLTKAVEELYVEKRFSTTTRTLVGVDSFGERNDGRYLDIVKSNSTGLPTQIVFYNKYSYVGEAGLPTQIRLSFTNGDVSTYFITFDNVPTFDMLEEAKTLRKNVTAHVWNGTPGRNDSFEIMEPFTIEFVIRASALTVYNSDATYTDMSVGDYKYSFAPYGEENGAQNLFNKNNYANEITYYVGGQFISAENWWNEGRTFGETTIYDANWTKRHAMYTVYGGTFREGDVSFGKFYSYNRTNRAYFRYTGAVAYDSDERTYKDVNGNDLYIFVYVTTQSLSADWDTFGASFGYRGGNVPVKANVSSKVNGFKSTLEVITRVESGKMQSFDFGSSLTANHGKFYDKVNNRFVIDPFANGNAFERSGSKMYKGTKYTLLVDGVTFVEDNVNGTYKKVGNQYIELTYQELGEYTYFPNYIYIKGEGATSSVRVPIEWDMSGVNFSYAGGSFYAYAVINANGEFDYGVEDYTNSLGVQRVRVEVVISDRTITGMASNTELNSLKGYANATSKTYINAYDYKLPEMPNVLRLYTAGNKAVNFYERGVSNSDADYAGVLSWSYNKFRPTYEGGAIFVTANLTGADGSTQSYDIPFLVDRRYVHHIMSNTSGVSFNAYVNNDGNAFTNTTFTIPANFQVDPNNGNTLSLPSSYNVTFRVQTPTYNVSTGDITWSATTTQADSAATLFRYVIVSMPAGLKWNIGSSGITTPDSSYNATIQIRSQQRITVPVTIKSSFAVSGVTLTNLDVSTSGWRDTLPTSYTYNGNKVKIAWYGKADIYRVGSTTAIEATYPVIFTSNNDTVELPTQGIRRVRYRLYAAVSTVVDVNGSLLATTAATSSKTAVDKGQTIPLAQFYISSMVTLTKN